MLDVSKCTNCGSSVEPEWSVCAECGEKLAPSLSCAPRGKQLNADWQPGKPFRDEDYSPDMVVIPAGEFMMGSPMEEPERDSSEGPQHRVVIATPFALGKYAVTFAEFDHFVQVAGYDHHPEDEVGRWERITVYPRKRNGSMRVGQGRRHRSVLVRWSIRARRTIIATALMGQVVKESTERRRCRLGLFPRTRLVYTRCMGMSGNG
jgi:formylglycine-generating enzyme required for sulfatase activity